MWWIAPLALLGHCVGDTGGVVYLGGGSKACGVGQNRCGDRKNTLTVAGPLMSARFAGWYSFGKIDSLYLP